MFAEVETEETKKDTSWKEGGCFFFTDYDPDKEADYLEVLELALDRLDDLCNSIVAEAKRIGLAVDGWDFFDGTHHRFFVFKTPEDAERFLNLVDTEGECDSWEEGDYSVDVSRQKLNVALGRLKEAKPRRLVESLGSRLLEVVGQSEKEAAELIEKKRRETEKELAG